MRRPLPCLPLVLLVGACSGQVTVPSLMPRPVERQSIDMPASSPSEADSVADAALQEAVAGHVARARKADQDFAAQRSRTEAAVARAARVPAGADAWVEAQQAISALENARAPLRDEAAAIDALRDDPANAAPGNRAAIDAAAAQVAALEQAEAAAIAALGARLR